MADAPFLGSDADEAEDQIEASAAGIAIALEGAKDNPLLTGPITEFLAEQRALIADQRHHLGEQLKRLRLNIIDQRMSIVLKAMTAAVGLAVAVGLGCAIWYAAHDNGLVIEAFSVPPDMAARGLTGQAVAAQLQDKLAAMQNATKSARPAESYANNWGNDIKVQIPETGVSIGEFYGLLVTWLGRETHITGEVFRSANGIAITARGGGDGGATVAGSEADLDKLLQQAAEAIYRRTQPYRYAVYIQSSTPPQNDRAREIYQEMVAQGSPRDRAWAYVGLSNLDNASGALRHSVENLRQALAIDPKFAMAYGNLDNAEASLGHDEAQLAAARADVAVLQQNRNIDMSEQARTVTLPGEQSTVDFALSDFSAGLRDNEGITRLPNYNNSVDNARQNIVAALALLHENTAALQTLRALPAAGDVNQRADRMVTEYVAICLMGDWPQVIARYADFAKDVLRSFTALGGSPGLVKNFLAHQIWPYVALAMAETGDFKSAHALMDQTPSDCYLCLRMRGDVDAAEKNWAGAAYWFGVAIKQAPSIPAAYSDWGAMLLAKGDFDGAIAKFSAAHVKGPHFADPLEMWGEALIAKNRSDLALAKFEEANHYAPNWGRLHLKWGEALFWLRRTDEAQQQFARATHLDLSTHDRMELNKAVQHG
jgi:tetratricopeptide (TPR) repeat protein